MKGIKKFFVNDQGAVSVYLIIITLLFFIFNAVLIDFARVLVAQKKVDTAARAAARSTMASFDSGVRKYGLFVMDGDPQQDFQTLFEENLNVNEGRFYHFASPRPEKSSVIEEKNYTLLNESTQKNQILEEMKYRAPIEFIKEIVDQFTQVSEGVESASEFAHAASEIEQDVKDRTKKMDEVEEHLKTAKKELGKANGLLSDKPSGSDYPEVKNLADIIEKYPTFNSGDDKDKDAEYVDKSTVLLGKLKVAYDKSNQELDDALTALEQVKKINKKIKDKLKSTHSANEDNYGGVTEAIPDNATGSTGSDASQIDSLTEDLNNYVYGDDFFTELKTKIQNAKDAIGTREDQKSLAGAYTLLLAFISVQHDSDDQLSVLSQAMKRYFKNADQAIGEAISYLQSNRKVPKGGDEEKQQEEAEDEAKDKMDEGKETLDKLVKGADLANDRYIYDALQGLLKKYDAADDEIHPQIDLDDPEDSANDILSMVDKLFGVLGDVLKAGRDRAYINEYILTHFVSSKPFSPSDAESYLFENKQVEYILYGINKPGANYAAAYTELFALRYALNFVYALTQTKFPFPLVTFIVAAGEAFIYTVDDMTKLVGNKPQSVPVYRRLRGVEFDYKDYLRLFLFMHPGEDNRLRRSLAVVEEETGTDISKAPTYIGGEAKASVDLWFLPTAMKLISDVGAISGDVRGGRYYITSKVAYSY
ncbi:hypothetical protein JOD43_001489 [Pullulanibacillus pueri]|uniref:TadE-like domain-containing protein n=1 Tax=Pullulanibacillus pueri TaxID=1437324 RepID=A0A8J2ZTG0_9BACL|nr:DUF5702 domain-containing protein [Pullulanibacillus pueri]MBM7681322.1 hypothetical protein [Pullulanibacillus pueri]GGH77595.1 hypothetical protein GCM10007096_09720 [Pullulanibacillus pueri]